MFSYHLPEMGTRNLTLSAFLMRYKERATTCWHQKMSFVSQLHVTEVILHLKKEENWSSHTQRVQLGKHRTRDRQQIFLQRIWMESKISFYTRKVYPLAYTTGRPAYVKYCPNRDKITIGPNSLEQIKWIVIVY